MSKSLIKLALEGTDEARKRLFALVSDLVVANLDQRTDRELAIFSEVILKLYNIGQVEDRSQLSRKLAPHANMPRDLALRMAEDQVGVAAPVLAGSPVLSPEDLLSFASRLGKEHLQFMAGRPDLTAEISDTLVKRGDKPVHRTLAGNRKAQLSRETMRKFVELAVEDGLLMDSLALRSDLPPAACQALLPHVNEETKQHLHKVIEGSLSQQQLEQIARLKLLRREFGQALANTDMNLLWREAERAHVTIDELMILLLHERRFIQVTELLAIRGRTTQKSFKDAVFSGKRDLVLRTAAKAGLQASTFSLFASARCDHMKIPSTQGAEWTSAYIEHLENTAAAKRSRHGDFQARRKDKTASPRGLKTALLPAT